MIYFLYNLLKAIYFYEKKWSEILAKKEEELNQRQESLDTLFKLFDILTIRRDQIPETGDFILRFKRLDMAMEKDFNKHPEKYAIIEEDK